MDQVGRNGAGYETGDAKPRVLMIYAIVLVAVLIAVELVLLGVYKGFQRTREPQPEIKATNTQVANIYEQRRQLQNAEAETLGGYGWVDRKAGIVRIPIERAMDLVAERGVPKGKGPRTAAEINSHHGIPAKAEEKDTKK